MTYHCTEKRFLKDITQHQMKVTSDDGTHRHITFSNNGSSTYHFELITWPGYLCITGDCGTYVFRRITDMFEFFRIDGNDFNHNKNGLSINPGYWAKKLEAEDGGGKHGKEWSSDKFEQAVKEHFHNRFPEEQHDDLTEADKLSKTEIWEEIKTWVLSSSSDEHEAVAAVNSFDTNSFQFDDFWERDTTDYTFHYLWCCYAIAWGIQQYDKYKGVSK